MLSSSDHRGFTLIELLVVIAIIAILSVVVVLTLSPAELLRQTRDQNRLSDMDTLTHALGLYTDDAAITSNVSLGTANTVYVSLPDSSSTCGSWNLPLLPSGYAYHCAPLSTLRKTDSTGWIPVNFSSITTGSPLGQLPIDPQNASSSRLYYTYTTNGTQYEVTASLESSKYGLGGSNDVISNDGGTLASVYEKGSKLGLEPLDYGDSSLVGLWTFDEGTSSIAYDYSGNNATGSWSGTQAGTSGYYSPGKIGPWAGYLNGGNDYVLTQASVNTPTAFTVVAWLDPAPSSSAQTFLTNNNDTFRSILNSGNSVQIHIQGVNSVNILTVGFTPPANTWFHYAATFDGSTGKIYINGAYNYSGSGPTLPLTSGSGVQIGDEAPSGYQAYNGYIDDVRIYNRALTAAQIQALYSGGK